VKLLKNSVLALVACFGLTTLAQAQWVTQFERAALEKMAPLAAVRSAAKTAAENAAESAAFTKATQVLASNNFVKDILRNDASPEVYISQIKSVEAAYLYINFLSGTDNSLSVESVRTIKGLLEEATLLDPVIRQTWISKLESESLSEEKYPYLLKSMEEYCGFGTAEDVRLLAQKGNLENSKAIQQVTNLYKDYATRLDTFIKQHNRRPQQLAISSEEEKALAREGAMLQFVKDINDYNPVRPIVVQIENLMQTVK